MRFIKWHLGIVGVAFFGIAALSEAFEIELKQEKIAEVAEYGKKYKGKEIFYSPVVKSACFGKYPDGEGGLIMSKYVRIAVISAMMALKDKLRGVVGTFQYEKVNPKASAAVIVKTRKVQKKYTIDFSDVK